MKLFQGYYAGWDRCECGLRLVKVGASLRHRQGHLPLHRRVLDARERERIDGQQAREEAAERYAERVLSTDGPVFNGERYE